MKALDDDALLRAFGWARLALAVLLLVMGPFLPTDLMPRTNTGILATALLVALGSSAVLLLLPPLAQPRRLAWLISLLDVVLATAVVTATGGASSIFTFLYVLIVTAACLLLSRTGGLVMAAVASILYSGLVFGRTVFPMTAFFEPPHATTALEILTMFMNSGTFLIVAIVAGGLAERFRATQRELETQRQGLRDLQAFNDLLFHAAGTGLVALDRDHIITAFNAAAAEITGSPAQRAIGGPWSAVFGEVVPLPAVERALEEDPRASTRHEVDVRRPDGVLVPVRMIFFALRSGDGTRLGLIAVCEDLSPIREMEARVRQADRLASLGRMAANIAHEIRNPLGSLTGAIEALAAGGLPGDQRDRLANIVLRESGRLNDIIKNFLDYARPTPLARTAVDVTEVLDEIAVLLEHGAAAGRLKIARDYAGPLVWSLDAQQFRQALWNLCLNAQEAMPQGGELRLAAAVHRGRLQITVSDTGEGIPAADLAQVFEPFFSTKTGGSGLGLALVHRIVQEHGGEIDVQSAPGFGTSFTVRLPERHG